MKLNTKIRYGLRALIEINTEGDLGLLQKDIAERQKISIKYLDPIIAALKVKGLIRNVKGKKSGYILAKSADEISVYDVYCAFEPELAIVECLQEPNTCDLHGKCLVNGYWDELNRDIKNSMQQQKLKDFFK
ncbi:MAG: Rrf2 family transcriptional regulator [Bacteroidales bacterium]|jgi:Rrf2 family protein|nr:Rrf2 family transcriptional regulator [Bacteroidales bacterium]MDD4383962.1 Rrf2 family transcriptional regulator [Bacteroidales bacterium]MDY0196367.1 Rrf2 family transcriptional regulator [Tenuifilaceae bacterium]